MRKYFIILSISLLASGCIKQAVPPTQTPPDQNQQPTSTPPSATSNWNTYTSPDKYGFSIKYPSGFGFTTDLSKVQGLSYIPVCDQTMVACIYLTRDTFKATNFDGAGVSINIVPLATADDCYNFKVPTNEAQTQIGDVTINGVVFKSATGGGGAAGHLDKLQIYRTIHDGTCWEISQDVVSTNIGNYPPGTVSQFDENAVWQKLQGVVDTFEFTDSKQSDNGWTLTSGDPNDTCSSPSFSGSVAVKGWYVQGDVPYQPDQKAWYLKIDGSDISKLPIQLQAVYKGDSSLEIILNQPDNSLVAKLKQASESNPQAIMLTQFSQYCEGLPSAIAKLP